MENKEIVKLNGVYKRFPPENGIYALSRIDLSFSGGEFAVWLGPVDPVKQRS
jgi:ABC-type sugar transport system ATPase subunit